MVLNVVPLAKLKYCYLIPDENTIQRESVNPKII